MRRKSGELFDARLYIAPLMDGHGQHSGWVASMTDISEPNRVRAELAAARERFTLVLEVPSAEVLDKLRNAIRQIPGVMGCRRA